MSIITNNLYFTYSLKHQKNKIFVLNDINIEIPLDQTTAIVGKTGSGKSTLIQTFNGLIKPYSGFVKFDDFIISNKKTKNLKKLRQKIGVVFQFPEYQLFEETVLKDVAFGPKNFGCSEEEAIKKAKAALSLLSIDETYYERSPFELSGGERRKIALAGILAIEPEIIIFDEPTAGLDNKSIRDLISLFKVLRNDHKTLILVTHDMNLVYEHCDNVIVLQNGKVAFNGNPELLFNEHKNDFNLRSPNIISTMNIIKKYSNNKSGNIKNMADLISFLKDEIQNG